MTIFIAEIFALCFHQSCQYNWHLLCLSSKCTYWVDLCMYMCQLFYIVSSGQNLKHVKLMSNLCANLIVCYSNSVARAVCLLNLSFWFCTLQFCLKLALLAALPEYYGGLDGRVVYIDTESKFSSRRQLKFLFTVYYSQVCSL